MPTVKWSTFTARSGLMPTQLDGLANATLSAASTILDNGINLDTHCHIEVVLDSVTFVAPAYLEIYMVKSLNGTNYEPAPIIGGASRNTRIATIPVPPGASAQRPMTEALIVLPPCKVRFYIGNQANVAFNNTTPTNDLNIYTTNLTS